eukprot:8463694-Pyramimonas_sp.AAC.1
MGARPAAFRLNATTLHWQVGIPNIVGHKILTSLRTAARYGLRACRIGEASHPGPTDMHLPDMLRKVANLMGVRASTLHADAEIGDQIGA